MSAIFTSVGSSLASALHSIQSVFHHQEPEVDQYDMPRRNNRPSRTARLAARVRQLEAEKSQEAKRQVFQCQLAHGSPTVLITGLDSVTDLYEKIANEYDGLKSEDILYCTVNTYKVNMDALLSGQIALKDFIFAHIKGPKKEVEIVKEEAMMGVTVADNGSGKVFIKRVKADSLVGRLSPALLRPGDHIEKLNDESMVGKRHLQVSKALRDIPVGQKVKLRLIEPLQSGFSLLAPRSRVSTGVKQVVDCGMQTVRFKCSGGAVIQEAPDRSIVERLSRAIEEYLGISDQDLALSIWELGKDLQSSADFAVALSESEFAPFGMPDDLIFDLWGAIKDWKDDRQPNN